MEEYTEYDIIRVKGEYNMNQNFVADISEFQSGINYKGLSNEVGFVWVRISDGATHYDRRVAEHIKGFKDCGANNYGFYWYLRPWDYKDGYAEATQVLKWIKEFDDITKSKRPIMLDVEEYTVRQGTMREAVQGCIDALLNAGVEKKQIWLYIANDKFDAFNLPKEYKTVVPRYAYADRTVNEPIWSVQPHRGENLWQFSCTYSSPNVSSGWIDMSVFMNNSSLVDIYPFDRKPSYYHAILKRVRLKQTTNIYKDKDLNTVLRSYPRGEEFELVPEKPYQTPGGATRYKTQSGFYITGNQDYVNSIYYLQDSYNGSHTIELTKSAYIYEDKYFEKPVRTYPTGTQFNIVENVFISSGRRAFKTQSGFYITANKDYAVFV